MILREWPVLGNKTPPASVIPPMPQCECGNERGHARTCARCRYLDGKNVAQQRLIDFMRDQGRVATQQVVRSLGIDPGAASRMLHRLVRDDRARRDESNGEATYSLTTKQEVVLKPRCELKPGETFRVQPSELYKEVDEIWVVVDDMTEVGLWFGSRAEHGRFMPNTPVIVL